MNKLNYVNAQLHFSSKHTRNGIVCEGEVRPKRVFQFYVFDLDYNKTGNAHEQMQYLLNGGHEAVNTVRVMFNHSLRSERTNFSNFD